MNALLAFSASHLAWQTKNADTENLAFYHSGIALRGLHEAIGAFSEQNSEAVLATSILLLWQATEWYVPFRSFQLGLCLMDVQANLGFPPTRCFHSELGLERTSAI